MNWYYAQGDQRQGPVTDSELQALIAAGTVNDNTLVWKEGMANWAPLKEARPTGPSGEQAPPGWIRCTATGRYFPPEEIVYLDGKPYSAAAKAGVLQGVMQTGSLPTSEVGRSGPAWENRTELGFFPAIMQTVKDVLLEPATAFSFMKREGGLGNPLGYHVLMSWLGFLVVAVYNVVFQGIFNPLTHNSQAPISPFAMSATVMGIMVVLVPIFTVIGAFIMAGVFHLSLMLFQGAKQPFESTFRTFCYAFGSVAPLQLIPACGSTIGFIWGVVVMCIGVSKVHEINTGRGVAAVLVPIVLCCAVALVFYAVIIAAAIGSMRAGQH